MSSPSKKKGYYNEVRLVNHLISLGFQAKRIVVGVDPSHGSVDVEALLDGTLFTFQVKSRKESFKTVYTLYKILREKGPVARFCYEGKLIEISDSILPLMQGGGIYVFLKEGLLKQHKRTLNKILKMQEMVGKSQFLVVKDDHKEFLYLRYR